MHEVTKVGPRDDISDLIRKDTGKLASSLQCRNTGRRQPSAARKRVLTRNSPCWLLNSEKIDFCCLNHPVYDILIWQPEQTKTDRLLTTSEPWCLTYEKCGKDVVNTS